MREALPGRRAVRGLTVAIGGLFMGHVLIYRIVAPSGLERAILLAGTGHSYLPLAVTLGATVATVAAITAFLLGVRRGSSPHLAPARPRGYGGEPEAERTRTVQTRGRRLSLIRALAVPAVAQAAALVALELFERALAGPPPGRPPRPPPAPGGLPPPPRRA